MACRYSLSCNPMSVPQLLGEGRRGERGERGQGQFRVATSLSNLLSFKRRPAGCRSVPSRVQLMHPDRPNTLPLMPRHRCGHTVTSFGRGAKMPRERYSPTRNSMLVGERRVCPGCSSGSWPRSRHGRLPPTVRAEASRFSSPTAPGPPPAPAAPRQSGNIASPCSACLHQSSTSRGPAPFSTVNSPARGRSNPVAWGGLVRLPARAITSRSRVLAGRAILAIVSLDCSFPLPFSSPKRTGKLRLRRRSTRGCRVLVPTGRDNRWEPFLPLP